MNAAVAAATAPRLVPRDAPRRDRALPIIIVVSLLVHATALLLFVGRADRSPAPPREIPIELVQLPKPPPPAANPAPKQPPSPKQAHSVPPKPAEKPAARSEKPAPRPAPKPAEKSAAKPKAQEARPRQSVADRMQALIGPTSLGMPAVAMPGEAADGTDAVSYSQLVLSRIAKAKREGRHQGVPGYSSVAFSLGIAGQVVSASIVGSSGDPALDEEAIAMVHRGEPFPPPPVGGQRDYAITLVFRAMP